MKSTINGVGTRRLVRLNGRADRAANQPQSLVRLVCRVDTEQLLGLVDCQHDCCRSPSPGDDNSSACAFAPNWYVQVCGRGRTDLPRGWLSPRPD